MIKPILFNADMVCAILDGRTTVTRRIVKPKSKNACGFYVTFRKSDNAFMGVYDYDDGERIFENSQTPPYQPGDILYVRETFVQVAKHIFWYKAGIKPPELKNILWKPSIHMPREAARIWLKVTDVRVERLQNITADGIRSEGLSSMAVHAGDMEITLKEWELLWNSTIKKSALDRYGWDANPWVWVIEFERCGKPDENTGSNN